MTREITRNNNFVAIPLIEGEKVSIAIDGEIVLNMIMPVDCSLNCYMKREQAAIKFTE